MAYRTFLTRAFSWIWISLAIAACQSSSSSGQTELANSVENNLDLFVSLPAADAVQRIRIANGTTIAQFEVGMLPHDFLANTNGDKLYLVLVGSQAVAEIDVASNRVARTFLTEPVPAQRANGSVIQGHFDQDAFSHTTCFDCHHGGDGGVKPAVVGSRPLGIAWSETHDALLVTNSRSSTLAIIDIASGQIRRTVTLAPNAVAHEPAALAAASNRIVIALRPKQPSFDASNIVVMDANDYSVISETPAGSNANHVIVVESDRAAYVSDFESNIITRLGVEANPTASKYTVGNGPLGVRPLDTSTLLAANYYQNSISLIDKTSGNNSEIPLRIDSQYFSNPTKIAVDASKKFAYVVASGTRGDVLELDLRTNRFVRAFGVGGLPFDIALVAPSAESNSTK